MKFIVLFFSTIISLATFSANAEMAESTQNYLQHCAQCHGAQRLGAMGPALLPQNLSRLKKPAAVDVIANGRTATQMPGFSEKLSPKEINQLAGYIYTPSPITPSWDIQAIKGSHEQHYQSEQLGDEPVFEADLQNLFIVVELGDHHATLLDGDMFEPIHRFKTRFAVHGGPKYTRDGRYVYFASRDGWISKFDIYNLKTVAEIRAGINTRNLAVSYDGRYVAVGNYLPHNLVILDAKDLSPIKIIPTQGDGGTTSRVSAVYTAPTRNSFIAALKDIPEVWEIPYGDIDEKLSEGKPNFVPRRIKLDDYLDDFFFNQSYSQVIGAARPTDSGGKKSKIKGGLVIDLDSGKKIATLELPGMPHLGSGITWRYQGKTVLASPNFSTGEISVIDMDSWKTIKTIKTEGPGFFMRSHANSPYAWGDVFFGPNKDKMHVIDKKTLEIVKTLQPEPGKTSGHVEFTKDGRYALVSIWDIEGALVIYDAQTLEEIKRLPMSKPSGKYNVYNKTHYEEGTSH
ncbi:MAG: c-type cytochrome [Porticoccus sp.]|nr:c-type cytochrome [Porticoccus sp.]MBQ0808076.1 c-type cytochrome [Porticoccus sp.]